MEQNPNTAVVTIDTTLNPAPATPTPQPVSATRVPDPLPLAPLPSAGTPPFDLPDLSTAQIKVLEALAAGTSLAEASRIADINPGTIYRWKKSDPRFIVALNAWRAEAATCARDRVLALADEAARAAYRLLLKNNPVVTLALLKATGGLSPQKPGTTDLDEAADTLRKEQRERAHAHRKRLWDEAETIRSDTQCALWRRAGNQERLEKTHALAGKEPESVLRGHRQADELHLEADGLPTEDDVLPKALEGKAEQKVEEK